LAVSVFGFRSAAWVGAGIVAILRRVGRPRSSFPLLMTPNRRIPLLMRPEPNPEVDRTMRKAEAQTCESAAGKRTAFQRPSSPLITLMAWMGPNT